MLAFSYFQLAGDAADDDEQLVSSLNSQLTMFAIFEGIFCARSIENGRRSVARAQK